MRLPWENCRNFLPPPVAFAKLKDRDGSLEIALAG